MYVYTYVVEFRGDTYCSQFHSESVEASISLWLQYIEEITEEITYLDQHTLQELKEQVSDPSDKPIPLTGLKNIWCCSAQAKNGRFLINIVQTDVSIRN